MILDRWENWPFYFHGPMWERIFDFLRQLGPDSEERRYELDDEGLHATVASYRTRPPAEAHFEAHDRHSDIQALLAGREIVECHPRAGLVPLTPFDAGRDVAFFESPAQPALTIALRPGLFAVFHDRDAHRPGLSAAGAEGTVKKCVIKVPLARLRT